MIRKFSLISIFFTILLISSIAYGNEQKGISQPRIELGKSFQYIAKKLGIPIFKATLTINNGTSEKGRSFYQIQAHVNSLHLDILFRMNNHFTSTIDAETFSPIQYMKEIDQEGLLIGGKKYHQTLIFDSNDQKVVVEKKGDRERRAIFLPPETHDPLSMFARYYLRDDLHPGQDIQMSIYDGVKLRQMVFHSKKERVKTKIYGEVEAVCLESATSFTTFGEKEGKIRIWYTTDKEKIPISMELDLPVGNIRFELEEIKVGGRIG